MNMKKLLTCGLCCTLAAGLLAGCTGDGSNKTATGETELIPTVTTDGTYPIDTDVELSYWVGLTANVAAYASSMNDIPFTEYMEEETGIKINYVHPPTGQETEKFNLMVASQDLTDIVESTWTTYKGGPSKAIKDKTIIPLNEALEKNVSPNYQQFLEENPEIAASIQTDDGEFYMYPFVTKDSILQTSIGFMVRGDLLEEAGLDKPETLEDWETMLAAFKELGVKAPITMSLTNSELSNMSAFMGTYGIKSDFYLDGETVKFGQYEKAYGEWIKTMKKWYDNGWLDSEFVNNDTKRVDALIINGNAGAMSGYNGSNFGKWIGGMATAVPDAYLTPVPYVAQNRGETPLLGHKQLPVRGLGAAVTSKCKNVEIAVRYLDYGFSEQGHMTYNFGREGISYEMKDGIPTYTDLIMDPEQNGGLSTSQAMSKYIRGCYNGPFVQDPDYIMQMYTAEAQQEAMPIWANTQTEKYMMPLVTMTEEENNEYTNIMTDIDVYREEMRFKFITGQEPIENLDQYFEQLKSMNIERAIEIQQAAYDRYKERVAAAQ